MSVDDVKILLKAISRTEGFRPTEWEKSFLRRMRGESRRGIRPSFTDGKKLCEIYRKSQWDSFNYQPKPPAGQRGFFYQYA